jgi:hypothetical protein
MPTTATPNIFALPFTDVYGIHHEDAQLYISSLSRGSTVSFGEKGEIVGESSTAHFQIRFWHDAAALEAGARTQDMVTKAGQSTFYLQSIKPDATNAEVLALCTAHFKDEVLPKLLEGAVMM